MTKKRKLKDKIKSICTVVSSGRHTLKIDILEAVLLEIQENNEQLRKRIDTLEKRNAKHWGI